MLLGSHPQLLPRMFPRNNLIRCHSCSLNDDFSISCVVFGQINNDRNVLNFEAVVCNAKKVVKERKKKFTHGLF